MIKGLAATQMLLLSMHPQYVLAQTQEQRPPLISQEDCKHISRRGPDEVYVEGPIQYGPMTIQKSVVGRNGIKVGAYTFFEAVEAVCFSKGGT